MQLGTLCFVSLAWNSEMEKAARKTHVPKAQNLRTIYIWQFPQHVFRCAPLLFLFLPTWLFIKGTTQNCAVIATSSGDMSILALSSTSYPSGVNSTPCNNSIQLEQVIHPYSLPTLFLSGGHLYPPQSIRARGVERRSGHNGRYDLLRQQIEGLYVVSRDAAHEILEAYVDQRMYPLDSVARRCRQHGLLQEGEERRRDLIQLCLDCFRT